MGENEILNEDWEKEFDAILRDLANSGTAAGVADAAALDADPKLIAGYIDHTILKLDATAEQIDQLCSEAKDWKFAAVCVRENFVARAKQNLSGSHIPIACVIGFHEGTQSTNSKLEETARALAAGALELDVVLNRDMLKAKDYSSVYKELKKIRQAAPRPVGLKLILETSMLDEKQIAVASTLAGFAGWDYIKTSTGFLGRGASLHDVQLMFKLSNIIAKRATHKNLSATRMKVKASGGIRTHADAKSMIHAGAHRIGASAGVMIMHEVIEKPAEL